MSGLTGKLIDVTVGDIIKLEGRKGRIIGFVYELRADRVTISHQDPLQPENPVELNLFVFTSNRRTYGLEIFDTYNILEKAKNANPLS